MTTTTIFNPLLDEGFQKLTTPNYMVFQTVEAARLGAWDATKSDSAAAFIEEKEAFYSYCDTCGLPDDGDLVLTTLNGGTSRWEMVQKVSRTQGDNGWIDYSTVTISKLNTTTLRLTVAGSAAYYSINSKRITLPVGTYDISFTGTARTIAVLMNASGALAQSDAVPSALFNATPVAVVFWTGTVIGGIQTEYHGIRDTVWHAWAHKYLGTQHTNGLQITTNTQPDTNVDPGADDTVQYLWLTNGVIHDEDTAVNIGTGQWLQTLGSGLTSATAAVIPFFYYNGVAVIGAAANANREPFLFTGANGAPQWENAGVLTAGTSGQYVVYHYFASPFINGYSVFARPHNAVFTTLVTAQAARPSSLTWSAIGEYKHIYSVVYRIGNWGGTPTHNAKIVNVQDFRLVSSGPSSGTNASAHGALSGLADAGAHPATAIAMDVATFDKNLATGDTTAQAVAIAFDEFNALPNNTTNASASPDLHNKTAFASVSEQQSATFTFDARGAIGFLVDVGTDGGFVVFCDYKSTGINVVSDFNDLFLATDAGTGVVVTKSANSAAVTVKNRMGSAKNIGILAIRSLLTSTAWS